MTVRLHFGVIFEFFEVQDVRKRIVQQVVLCRTKHSDAAQASSAPISDLIVRVLHKHITP